MQKLPTSTITASSQNETTAFGKRLASTLKAGDIVLLYGDLGAGKTTLVKGIADGLGVIDDIVSPTFTLMNIYKTNTQKSKSPELIHIDTYRLEHENQLIEIGAEDYLGSSDAICIIEWPEKLQNLLVNKNNLISIRLEHSGVDSRKITIDT